VRFFGQTPAFLADVSRAKCVSWFDWVRLGATGCDWVRLGATGCDWVRLGLTGLADMACKKRLKIAEINLKINDLRDPLGASAKGAEMPKRFCHKRNTKDTKDSKDKRKESSFFVVFGGLWWPVHFWLCPTTLPSSLPFPLQNVKEQAPERRSYSTLTRLDGNTTTIIHSFSAPTRFSVFLMAFSRAEGA
jgi:hypothetical protein